jgi:hypothetical protein
MFLDEIEAISERWILWDMENSLNSTEKHAYKRSWEQIEAYVEMIGDSIDIYS